MGLKLSIWQERDEPGHLPEAQFQQIKNLAVAQAAQLKGISSRQISMTFADMANTRPGWKVSTSVTFKGCLVRPFQPFLDVWPLKALAAGQSKCCVCLLLVCLSLR